MQYFSLLFRKLCYNSRASREYGLVAQLGERTVRIREVRGFDPLQVHHVRIAILTKWQSYFLPNSALNAFNYGCSWYFSTIRLKRNPEPGLFRIRILVFMV